MKEKYIDITARQGLYAKYELALFGAVSLLNVRVYTSAGATLRDAALASIALL